MHVLINWLIGLKRILLISTLIVGFWTHWQSFKVINKIIKIYKKFLIKLIFYFSFRFQKIKIFSKEALNTKRLKKIHIFCIKDMI